MSCNVTSGPAWTAAASTSGVDVTPPKPAQRPYRERHSFGVRNFRCSRRRRRSRHLFWGCAGLTSRRLSWLAVDRIADCKRVLDKYGPVLVFRAGVFLMGARAPLSFRGPRGRVKLGRVAQASPLYIIAPAFFSPRYPDRIPIIVERDEHARDSEIGPLSRNKFLVPPDLTGAQFICTLRNHIKLTERQSINLFVEQSHAGKKSHTLLKTRCVTTACLGLVKSVGGSTVPAPPVLIVTRSAASIFRSRTPTASCT